MTDQQRLFLGHASEDKAKVLELYHKLKAEGFAPWLDAEDLMPGRNWRAEIPKAIRSAAVFLACLSKNSAEKQGYVQREFRYALSAYADLPPGSIYMIPVRLDDCVVPDLRLPELELNLRDLHWVDLTEPNGYRKLVEVLRVAMGSPAAGQSNSGGDSRLFQVIASFEALFASAEKAVAGNNPAARRIRDNLADCLDDLHCCGKDFETIATLPSHLAGLAKDVDEHLLIRHFEAMPASEVLRELEALTDTTGDASDHRVDTLDREDMVNALKAAIGRALRELPGAGFERDFAEVADRELRHLRREVGKPSFDVTVVSERRRRLEDLKVDLLERAGLLTEALLAEGFPNLPTGTVFRHIPEMWCPPMVMIPAGNFVMGSPETEVERNENEGPQQTVRIAKGFGLGRHAVTFDEYDKFCDVNERQKPDDNGTMRGRYPAISVSYDDALAYCSWLSETSGVHCLLPSEAMWEYACRAGTTTTFNFGNNITTKQVNFNGHPYAGGVKGEARRGAIPVGSLPANAWGLHEMHGNVDEWCIDTWRDSYSSTPDDDPPRGDGMRTHRVVRGGSWFDAAWRSRAAYRYAFEPSYRDFNLGFRVACVWDS